MYIYGVHLPGVVKHFAPPLSKLSDKTRERLRKFDNELGRPSSSKQGSRMNAVEIWPELSAYFCHNLRTYTLLYVVADKYCVDGLKKSASIAFKELLCDCWNTSRLLEVIELVYSMTGDGSRRFRNPLTKGLAELIDLLTKDTRFNSLVRSNAYLGAELLQMTAIPRCRPARESEAIFFCPWYKCRKNVATRTEAYGIVVCKKCYDDSIPSCHLLEAKKRMWEDEETEEGFVVEDESPEMDSDPESIV